MICLTSFCSISTILSSPFSVEVPPSFVIISAILFTNILLSGRWNFTSKQWPARDRILVDCRSLQIQMMGILDFLIILMIAAIPPRSPLLMPSTSSMISKLFSSVFPIDSQVLSLLAAINSTFFLFLASLALNSTTPYPYSAANNLAVVVLPSPASPLSRAAAELILPEGRNELNEALTSLLFPLIWISSQLSNHSLKLFICECWPIISPMFWGLYFSVHWTDEEATLGCYLAGTYQLSSYVCRLLSTRAAFCGFIYSLSSTICSVSYLYSGCSVLVPVLSISIIILSIDFWGLGGSVFLFINSYRLLPVNLIKKLSS